MPSSFHHTIDRLEKHFPQMVFFQQMTKFQKRCCIRNLFLHKVDIHEFPECIAVIDCIFHTLVREIEPDLQQIHPQHFFDSFCRSATLAVWVIRAYKFYPFFPRNNLIHDVQEFFPLRFPLSQAVLIIAECHLAHFSFPPAFSLFSIISYLQRNGKI